jgi:hypothetical protein
MLNLPSTRCLLFGSTGRLGSLCANLVTARGIPFGNLQRNGDLLFAGSRIGNIDLGTAAPGPYTVIDASVDYTSLEHMETHEDMKLAFLETLNSRGDLGGLLAFSSGVVEFDDGVIKTEWHRRYKRLKLRLEGFARDLSGPSYCPRLFVVIGPYSFKVATTGWVDVIRQVCAGARVGMAMPGEPRSWVAETFLSGELSRYFDAPGEVRRTTPLNGTFCLGEIARFAAEQQNRPIVIEPRAVTGWLSVPYVSRAMPLKAREYALEHVLAPLVAAHAASLRQ